MGVLFEYMILSLKQHGLSRDTATAYLLDELDVLIVFLAWNKNHFLKALKYHHRIYMMERCNTLVERVYSLLKSRRDTKWRVRILRDCHFVFDKLFPVDISIDNCEVTEDKDFYSFEIHAISQQVRSWPDGRYCYICWR